MARNINVEISGQFVKKDNKNAGVMGEGNVTALHITFDESWRGCGKRIIWRNANGENPVAVLLFDVETGKEPTPLVYTTTIPMEPLEFPGWCSFSIEGCKEEDGIHKVALSVSDTLMVAQSDSYYKPAEPTPSQMRQILEALGKTEYAIQELFQLRISDSTDVNDWTENGFYQCAYSTLYTNAPEGDAAGERFCRVQKFGAILFQEWWNSRARTLFVRRYADGAWGEWRDMYGNLIEKIDKIPLYNPSQNSETKKYVERENTESGENTGVDIRVCSYNIGRYNMGNSQAGMEESVIPEKLTALKKFLLWVNCDLFCLQEDAEFIDKAQSRTTTGYLFKPMYPFIAGVGGVTVRSKTTIRNSGLYHFTTGRAMRYGTITWKGKNILAASAHFTPGTDYAEERKTELEELFAWLESADPEYFVVCGDFNISTDEDLSFFRSFCMEKEARIANGDYLPWQITSKSNGALDNMIVSKNIMVNQFSVLRNWESDLYSDHFPIAATLTLLG